MDRISLGIFPDNNQYYLRNIRKPDGDRYVMLQKEVMLSSAKYDDKILLEVWGDMFEKHCEAYAIISDATDDFCGYCAIKNTYHAKPEIAIELFKKYQSKGIGFSALQKMLAYVGERHNKPCFIAVVEPDNYASQGLMYKLGGVPGGIKKSGFLQEEDIDDFESENLNLLNSRINQIAKDFSVEPKKLLSHALVFDIAVHNGLCENAGNRNRVNLQNAKNDDRKISIAVRNYCMEAFLKKFELILEKGSSNVELKELLEKEKKRLDKLSGI